MITLAKLKQDLDLNRGLGDIIDVLKTTALIQFRSFQLKEKPNEDFVAEAEECFSMFVTKHVRHPYLFDRTSLASAIVVITSDEGFLGELNTLLINASLDQRKSARDELIILGERGTRYLEDMNENFIFFPGLSDDIKYKEVDALRSYLLKGYRKRFGRVSIIYPKFVSLTVQKVEVFMCLPYQNTRPFQKMPQYMLDEMELEPSADRALDSLVNLWMGFKLFDIFASSKQSEYAARIMHLEGSTQELAQVNQQLALQYFRQVHALSDKTIREISASKILLGKENKA